MGVCMPSLQAVVQTLREQLVHVAKCWTAVVKQPVQLKQ